MIGSPDFHPYGYSARWPVVARQRGSLRTLASFRSGTRLTPLKRILVLAARLRRFTNSRVAAAIAHHAQQASLYAPHQPDQLQLDRMRIYRGPVDLLLAWAVAWFRKRPRT